MGAIFSSLQKLYKSIQMLLKTLSRLNADFQPVLRRLKNDPGLPTPQPTAPYWLLEPLFPALVTKQSPVFLTEVDVVVIGSGITSAAIARTILQEWERKGERSKKLAVLEARELCSGATGRNGGHIKVAPYEAFSSLRLKHGDERAAEIVRFQMRHVDVLVDLCEKEEIYAAECRRIETVDVFLDGNAFDEKKRKVQELKESMPEVKVQLWEEKEAREAGPHPLVSAPMLTYSGIWLGSSRSRSILLPSWRSLPLPTRHLDLQCNHHQIPLQHLYRNLNTCYVN